MLDGDTTMELPSPRSTPVPAPTDPSMPGSFSLAGSVDHKQTLARASSENIGPRRLHLGGGGVADGPESSDDDTPLSMRVCTALNDACRGEDGRQAGDAERLRELIHSSMNVNRHARFKDSTLRSGETPLMSAIYSHSDKCVELLLCNRADPNLKANVDGIAGADTFASVDRSSAQCTCWQVTAKISATARRYSLR